MNRIDNIKNFAQKKVDEQAAKENSIIQQTAEYKQKILSLKPRIDELLKVGNACLEYGIELNGQEWGGREAYDTHQFVTNSWSHLLGFVRKFNHDTRQQEPFAQIGIMGGGACHYNLATDGVTIEVSGNVLWVLKQFVDDFDTFETEFYKYVDRVTAK